jgi:hypothetical protein
VKLKQVSLFLENVPGSITAPCRLLAQHGISILTLSLADTERFGILHLVLRDWQKAQDLLKTAGYAANVVDVLAVEVDDRPGGLVRVLESLERVAINVEYMYAFTLRKGKRAMLVLRVDDLEGAVRALNASNVPIVTSDDVYALFDG